MCHKSKDEEDLKKGTLKRHFFSVTFNNVERKLD
jgi:hypothetical protein